jgi:hypothetical protein
LATPEGEHVVKPRKEPAGLDEVDELVQGSHRVRALGVGEHPPGVSVLELVVVDGLQGAQVGSDEDIQEQIHRERLVAIAFHGRRDIAVEGEKLAGRASLDDSSGEIVVTFTLNHRSANA